jgi:hypothetical protein
LTTVHRLLIIARMEAIPGVALKVALLVSAIVMNAGDSPGVSAAGAASLATVPIVFTRNQVRVPVSIDGSAPFVLILDTGMPTRGVLLRHTERVDSLGLVFPGADTLSGGGDGPAVAARVATADHIKVGGLTIPEVPVIVLPAESGLPRDTDGVIGSELFEKFAVRIDVDRQRLELFDSATYQPATEAAIVPLRFREGSAFVDALVAVGSGPPVTADLAVDLGAGHSLWLNERADGSFAPPPNTPVTTLGRGLSGELRGSVGRVRRFELGGVAFEDVVTIFPVPEHQHPGGFDFRDGFVGAEILTRFHVTFDYPAKRMVLERGGRFSEPFEYDMTGMVLDPQGQDRRRVDAVVPGSPAAEAGVEAGDVLMAVDGASLAALGPDGLARAFRREGAEVGVTLQRGATIIEKRMRLRRLV